MTRRLAKAHATRATATGGLATYDIRVSAESGAFDVQRRLIVLETGLDSIEVLSCRFAAPVRAASSAATAANASIPAVASSTICAAITSGAGNEAGSDSEDPQVLRLRDGAHRATLEEEDVRLPPCA